MRWVGVFVTSRNVEIIHISTSKGFDGRGGEALWDRQRRCKGVGGMGEALWDRQRPLFFSANCLREVAGA